MLWICAKNKTKRNANKASTNGIATGKKNIDIQIAIALVCQKEFVGYSMPDYVLR